ncbi:MAG: hypothetical protein Fur0037_08780 [Planctomycetota bacterium]
MSTARCLFAVPTALLAVFCSPSTPRAQTEWSAAAPTAHPSARYGHVMAWDEERDRVILFGGENGTGLLSDTWEWDGQAWTPISTPTAPPASRYAAICFDSNRNEIVLFGGEGNDGTWEYDGGDWRRVATPHAPPARSRHAMAFDAIRGRAVLFGGISSGPLADTWEYDGGDWTRIVTVGHPSERSGHAMAFDGHRRRVVLFGGRTSASVVADTWEYDGNDWTLQYSLTLPPPRADHSMAFHPLRTRIVIHSGGWGIGDSWEWDGSNWWQPASFVPLPQRTIDQAMAYHRGTDRIVAFGGRTPGGGPIGITRLYRSIHPALASHRGEGCPGENGIPSIDLGPWSLPWVTDTLDLAITAVPTGSLPVLVLGFDQDRWNGVPLPHNFAPIGAPLCNGYVAPAAILPLVGSAALRPRIYVPPIPGISGLEVRLQSFLANAGGSPAGLAATDVLSLTVGWR